MGQRANGSLAGLFSTVQVAQDWHMTRCPHSRNTVLISRLKQMLQSSKVSSSWRRSDDSSSTCLCNKITFFRRNELSSHLISVWLPLFTLWLTKKHVSQSLNECCKDGISLEKELTRSEGTVRIMPLAEDEDGRNLCTD